MTDASSRPDQTRPGPPRRCAVFLDFDGTYADHGAVPAAHAEAVQAVRANGHHVLLCTGRPLAILPPELAGTFDGLVTSAGARVDIDGQTLCDERIDPETARRAVAVLEEHGAAYCLESPEAMNVPERAMDLLRTRLTSLLGSADPDSPATAGTRMIIDALTVPDDLAGCSFAKISIWDSPTGIRELAELVGPGLRALPNSITGDAARSGELQNARIDKADGVALVARHLGIDIADTVGAGDGMNDVGMLEAVGTAIGIEGSPAPVLAPADIIVPGPSQHGLVEAFTRIGLL